MTSLWSVRCKEGSRIRALLLAMDVLCYAFNGIASASLLLPSFYNSMTLFLMPKASLISLMEFLLRVLPSGMNNDCCFALLFFGLDVELC